MESFEQDVSAARLYLAGYVGVDRHGRVEALGPDHVRLGAGRTIERTETKGGN